MTEINGARAAATMLPGNEIIINTSTDGDQWLSDVVNIGDGRVAFAWQDLSISNNTVEGYIAISDEGGTIRVAETQVGLQSDAVYDIQLHEGDFGDFYVSWYTDVVASTLQLDESTRGDWFWYDGSRFVDEFSFSSAGAPDLDLVRAIDVLPGNLMLITNVVAFTIPTTTTVFDTDVIVSVFDATTQATIAEDIQLRFFSDNWAGESVYAAGPDGGFLAVWLETDSGTGSGSVRGQFFDASGSEVGGGFTIATGAGGNVDLAQLSDGSYVAVWDSYNYGSGSEVYAQHFDSDGNDLSDRVQVNETSSGNQFAPAVAALDSGGFVVTWSAENLDGDGYGVAARFYDLQFGELFEGTLASDVLYGGEGNDTVYGHDGDDLMWAGAGDTGDDLVFGGAGDDTVGGGAGSDILFGGYGSDIVFGGAGDDTLVGGEFANGQIDTTEAVSDQLWSGAGDDVVFGGEGADQIGGGLGHDLILAGGGDDVIYAGADGDDFISGGSGNDVIFGGSGIDVVSGDEGDDELYGGTGDDAVAGGDGADQLYGGAGADTLAGGAGDDTLRGGADADVFIFSAGTGADQIFGFSLEEDTLNLSAAAAGFVDLATVEKAASATDGGVLIDLGDGDSLLLADIALADLSDLQLVL